MTMRIVDIIAKKRDGLALASNEIEAFTHGVVRGTVSDEQAAAMLMAIRIRGMHAEETAALALSMASSGRMADLTGIAGRKVDKHSTGGVGDTTTLIAVPLAAALGVKVAKMSGRSLGHTGGTLDKLWAIPGTRTGFTIQELVRQVNDIGCAVVGQTGELAPADQKLYALRDVTATVDSLPLIASSILSKKIAAGCDAILLDVKCGSGALMQRLDEARELAHTMVRIGRHAGRRVTALITDMSQPLGSHIGNALEVREAALALQGKIDGPLVELSVIIAARMAQMGGVEGDLPALMERTRQALRDGSGLAKLRQMIQAQGGDPRAIDEPDRLPRARLQIPCPAPRSGFLTATDCARVGLAAQALGAGRARKEDAIDPAVGIVLHRRVGEPIREGEPVATLHAQDEAHAETARRMLTDALVIEAERIPPPPLVYEVIEDTESL